MQEILDKLQGLKDYHIFRQGEKKQIEKRLGELKRDKLTLDEEQVIAREAVLLLEYAGQGAREFITEKFNSIVTYALQSIFGMDYLFEVKLEIKRNAVWAEFQVKSGEYAEGANPLASRGGGVVDIVALALRVVLLELYTPQIGAPLILDEPTKWKSKATSARTSEWLRSISERTKRQIILVTHDEVLAKDAEGRLEL